MKYLILIFLYIPIIAVGQFSSGDKFIGGTFSIEIGRATESSEFYTDKSNYISVQPKIGFLINTSLAIGGTLGYSINKVENISQTSSFSFDNKSISFGLFIEKYISITENFMFSIEGDLSYFNNTYNNSFNDNRKTNSIKVLVKPVFIFFPSKKWGIEAGFGSIGFSHTKDTLNDELENVFNVDYGGLNLGLSYYFR